MAYIDITEIKWHILLNVSTLQETGGIHYIMHILQEVGSIHLLNVHISEGLGSFLYTTQTIV